MTVAVLAGGTEPRQGAAGRRLRGGWIRIARCSDAAADAVLKSQGRRVAGQDRRIGWPYVCGRGFLVIGQLCCGRRSRPRRAPARMLGRWGALSFAPVFILL